jgi:transcriptional regulator with XRE-family HTH domain
MNEKWPQQEVFCERVKQFALKNGYTTPRGAVRLDIVADMFNLQEQSLRQFLQHKLQKRPRYSTLAYISGILGCSVTDFLDDPGDPPSGVPSDRWTEMSERERVIASVMLADMTAADLTLPEKEELFGAFKDLKARILRLRK